MFIVAEIGSNWKCVPGEPSLRQAHLAINQAAEAGANAVKFQLFRNLYSKERTPILHERMKAYELPYEWLPRLKEICNFNGVEFWLSVFDKESVDASIGIVDGLKIASGDLTNKPLVEYVLMACQKATKALILSTGAATAEETYEALEWAAEYDLPWLAVLRCVSEYPARAIDYRLKNGLEFLSMVDEIGISDHTCDYDATVASLGLALGYTVFETHVRPVITDYIVEASESPDWNISLPTTFFAAYVKNLKAAGEIIGDGSWELTEGEEKERLWAQRGSDGFRPTDNIWELLPPVEDSP